MSRIESTVIENYDNLDSLTVLHFDSLRSTARKNSCVTKWTENPNNRSSLDEKIQSFWDLYDNVNPMFKCNFPSLETKERKSFAKHDFYILLKNEKVIGGLWIENVSNGNAHFLLKCFENESIEYNRYNSLNCGFNKREYCDPARFFRNRGYNIKSTNGYFYATKILNEKGSYFLQQHQ
jgi:hypothetical protein